MDEESRLPPGLLMAAAAIVEVAAVHAGAPHWLRIAERLVEEVGARRPAAVERPKVGMDG